MSKLKKQTLSYFKKVSISVLGLSIFTFVVTPLHDNIKKSLAEKDKIESSILKETEIKPNKGRDSVLINETLKDSSCNDGSFISCAFDAHYNELLLFEENMTLAIALNIPSNQSTYRRGFLSGLWHGYILFFTFILSFFFDISFYAEINTGWWYWIGFGIGALIIIIKPMFEGEFESE